MSIHDSIHGSYHYAGCYTHVFRESFFISSFMEPTLCFRLCDTPIIYLQTSVCRCSGGGLMHHGRQPDTSCSIPCTKPADRQIKTANTCGGLKTYSVYIEDNFYIRHGHLLNYQILFSACELWKTTDVYETSPIQLDQLKIESSLNKLERCAAACLDQNVTTKSIAFHDDNNQCLCILPWKLTTAFQRTHYSTILPNTSCDRYCDNTADNSKTDHKFQCGSLNDTRVWAIYDLNGTCPTDYVHIKELKKCLYTYRGFWSSCTYPSKNYIYDGSIPWNSFLQVIERLKLSESIVTIDFGDDVIVNSSWKCVSTTPDSSTSYYSRSYLGFYSWNTNTRYILDNGCLRESSYSSYSHRYSYRLCVLNPLNKYSTTTTNGLDDDDDDSNSTMVIDALEPTLKFCPTNWFDLNGRCYRMSDEKKTIHQAKNSCITITKSETNTNDRSRFWSDDDYDDSEEDNDDDQLNDSPKGEIVQYTSDWQTRLGFFLLDTVPETDIMDIYTSTSSVNINPEDLNPIINDFDTYHFENDEFQMISPIENTNSSLMNDTCVILKREIPTGEEKSLIKNLPTNNCSQPRYTFCETKTLIVREFQQSCFSRPLTFDLPALISNRLTYELCLSVCKELQTKIAIIHLDKCYCLNGFTSTKFNLTIDLEKYQKQDCGSPCSGNQHERCGNKDIIVVFYILDPRRTFTYASTPAETFPDFIYDSCINVTSLNSSTTYQFNLNNKKNIHPRHCLELCTKYKQKYALINSNKCLCTNIPIKNDQDNIDILSNQYCSQECTANYFYTCGNKMNSNIYSLYIMKPKCRHGFEIAENDQQCVYSHYSVKMKSFSDAQSYCQSLGGVVAKINDISEIQDILPRSFTYTATTKLFPLFIYFKYFNDTKYFWIDRTTNIPDEHTIGERLLDKCGNLSENIDQNCLLILRGPNSHTDTLSYKRCITQSNQCSVQSAIPVCVDQHLESNPTYINFNTNEPDISSTVSIDYSCGDDNDYHFIDDYCYKIINHEVNWNNAKGECERDNAMLFVPEKSITLQIIKSLYLHRSSYTSSGFAHVGVMYDLQNRTVIEYNTTDKNVIKTVPDSNAVYDLCERTFYERYTALTTSTSLPLLERNKLKKQQIGCGYIDLLSYTVPVIRCDEIPCNRTATVICQKSPIIKTDVMKAKREMVSIATNPTIISTDDETTDVNSDSNSEQSIKSIGRDFAPIFFVLAILFALLLLGFMNILYNNRLLHKNSNTLHRSRFNNNNNNIYSQLTTENEFDLN